MVVFALTFALLLAIVVLRTLLTLRKKHEEHLGQRWHPVFLHAIEDLPCETPRVLGVDREIVLMQWIEMVESIRGVARERLRNLALKLKFDRTAHKLLARRNLRSKLIGVTVLGRLRDPGSWQVLLDTLNGPNSLLALIAAHALLQIEPIRALPHVFAQVARHDDWPMAQVAAMITEQRTPAVAATLKLTLNRANPAAIPRLLQLLGVTQVDNPWLLLEPFLDPEQPVPVLAAALKVCRDPRAFMHAHELASHESWVVRAQAAAALGHIGIAEDEPLLRELLSDPEWWVRYRAAQSLTRLPFVPRSALVELCEEADDPFARQIMRQVLVETEKAAA